MKDSKTDPFQLGLLTFPESKKSNPFALLRNGLPGLTASEYAVRALRSPHQSERIRFFRSEGNGSTPLKRFGFGSLRTIGLSLLLVFLVRAPAVEANTVGNATVTVVRDVPSDFFLPPMLWDLLLTHSVQKEMKASVEGQEDEVQGSSVLFASLSVRLIEKNPGILKSPVMEFQFPKGGGQIDLSHVTTGNPGTFFVQFDLADSTLNPTFEAFHLSKARKRKFDDRTFGGGCKSFTKITKVLLAPRHSNGMPFNTTKDLHVSALGGHFLFSWSDGDATTVTQVKFFDSTKPQYSCQSEAETGTTPPVSGEE